METQLLYSQTLYIPTNIRYYMLFEECKRFGITFDTEKTRRTFTFYAKSENDIRYIQTRFILKQI